MKKENLIKWALLSLAGGISFSFTSFVYDISIDSYRTVYSYAVEAGIISLVFLFGLYFIVLNKKKRI